MTGVQTERVRPRERQGNLLRQLGRLLGELGAVRGEQWEQAVRSARGPDDWAAPLSALKRMRAGWAPPGDGPPCLTDFQHSAVVRLIRAGRLDLLSRHLRLNNYLILTELGRGGMGVVFKAWDFSRRRFVAVKVLRDKTDELRQRFRREALILARLHHPGIARLLSLEKAGRAELLVMEYVPGRTVHDHVKGLQQQGRALPWRWVAAWAIEALLALDHAHQCGVIHRDVKPGNLMVQGGKGQKPVLKLLDLGLAKLGAGDGLTADDQVLGTCEYMPPEQWAGAKVGPACDLYALGGTLFFMLTGRPPFGANALAKLWMSHSAASRPSVRQLRPDVPPALDALVRRMMAIDAAGRGTPRQLAGALRRLLARGRGAREAATRPPRPLPARRPPVRVSEPTPLPVRTSRGPLLASGWQLLLTIWRRLRPAQSGRRGLP